MSKFKYNFSSASGKPSRWALRSWSALTLLLPPLLISLLIYIALSPMVAMSMYNTMIFDPDRDGEMHPKQIDNCRVQFFWIPTSDGRKLFAWYVQQPHAHKTILLSHGNGGDLSDRVELIDKLLRAGASVLAYDYEGFGLSPGRPSVDAVCADGLAAYDYLTQRINVKPQDVVLFGESLGTGVTCQIAKRRQSDGLILQSPFTSLLDIAREKDKFLCIYPTALFPEQRLDSLTVLEGSHPRVLIVHGAKDDVVPLHEGLQLFGCARAPKQMVVLPDAMHEDMPHTDASLYDAALRAFIQSS